MYWWLQLSTIYFQYVPVYGWSSGFSYRHSGASASSNSRPINEHVLCTHAHLLHASLNLPGMELVWNCGIPPKTPILFYSIPGRNTLTCIQYKFIPQSAKFQNHSNSDISIPKHLPSPSPCSNASTSPMFP